MKKLLLFICAILVFSSCHKECSAPNLPKDSYTINVKDRLSFDLENCQGCGTQWQWKNSPNDHLKMIKSSHTDCPNGGVSGGKRIDSFVFEGTQKGNDSIVMIYRHPFDPDTLPPSKKQIIYVTVN